MSHTLNTRPSKKEKRREERGGAGKGGRKSGTLLACCLEQNQRTHAHTHFVPLDCGLGSMLGNARPLTYS